MGAPAAGGLALAVVGLGLFLTGIRLQDRWARGGGLLVTLTGFFVTFTSLLWKADGGSPLLSTWLLLGAVGVFQLMTWFEPGPPAA
ncbi:MAG TPA: hypothetical protein VG457_06160 [Planctomycetota bacterium]|jgi:hypothetical protein|nr:hypothetical protein [Planctomycetota bacterium]